MSEPTRLGQSDFIVECRRLHAAHLAALASEDPEAIEAAVDAFSFFLRMNANGRLQEYFENRQAEAAHGQ